MMVILFTETPYITDYMTKTGSSIFEDANTGEPVCVHMDYDIETFTTSCIIYTTLPGDSHDVAISVYDEVVKKLTKNICLMI